MIERWTHPDKKSHLLGVVQGLAEIVDGLVIVLSFGYFVSNFSMKVCAYRALSYYRRKNKQELNK